MRTSETINPVQYEIELVREGDRVVEVNISAVEGAELTFAQVRNAMQAVLDHLRPTRQRFDESDPRGLRPRGRSRTAVASESLGLPQPQIHALIRAYEMGDGRVTDEYLARLAVAYANAAPGTRDVSMRLANALGRPIQTVKGHIMRARKEGFLTETVEGREGGEATRRALDLIPPGELDLR